jgi:fucose permease
MSAATNRNASQLLIMSLTFLMFLMFAMTTDAVGVIIPELVKEFKLSHSQASGFHYATMGGIALSGLCLGFLADKMGRKNTIILGLSLFALTSFLFYFGNEFSIFLGLLFVSGIAIGIFKTGALALISDISNSTKDHTRTMNLVEAFFAVGAMIGPALVTLLLKAGHSWKWLYVLAGILCVILMLIAMMVKYPSTQKSDEAPITIGGTLSTLKDPMALYFSLLIMLYVGAEVAIFVWMPTLLANYQGEAILIAAYATSIFFGLRAIGRFIGVWLLTVFSWTLVILICTLMIFACFLGASILGSQAAVWLLPFSGIFMSIIYPTLNSKGISCFPKRQHGAVSGVILFFTCVSAAVVPFFMGLISDRFNQDSRFGFFLATGLTAILFVVAIYNHLKNPSLARLRQLDQSEYGQN